MPLPGVLAMTTAIAPACSAYSAFSTNEDSPRLVTTMQPRTSVALRSLRRGQGFKLCSRYNEVLCASLYVFAALGVHYTGRSVETGRTVRQRRVGLPSLLLPGLSTRPCDQYSPSQQDAVLSWRAVHA